MKQAQFVPPLDGQPNQLTVTPPGAPADDRPSLPGRAGPPQGSDALPPLRGEPQGRLSGALERGKELRLTAERLIFEPGSDESGVFQVNVDGFKRAFWFRTGLVEQGSTQKAIEEQRAAASPLPVPTDPPARPAGTGPDPLRGGQGPARCDPVVHPREDRRQEVRLRPLVPAPTAQEAAHRLRPPRRGGCPPVRSLRRGLGRDLRRSRHPGPMPGSAPSSMMSEGRLLAEFTHRGRAGRSPTGDHQARNRPARSRRGPGRSTSRAR